MDEGSLYGRLGPRIKNSRRDGTTFNTFLGEIILAFLCVATLAGQAATWRALCSEERPMTVLFVVSHGQDCENDDNPVEDVCDDRAICCRVLPAE